MADMLLFVDDLKSELDKLKDEDRDALKLTIADIIFVFKTHAPTLEKVLGDSVLESMRRTLMPHIQALMVDQMLGSGIDWDALLSALFEAFPEMRKL
jgi:hypothetical protein